MSDDNFGLAQLKGEGDSYNTMTGKETTEQCIQNTEQWYEFRYDSAIVCSDYLLADFETIIEQRIKAHGWVDLNCYLVALHKKYCTPTDLCDEEMDAEIERNQAKGI